MGSGELVGVQTEVLRQFQEAAHIWVKHMQMEADLASEFSAKLATARSIPETATSLQEWAQRRTELFAQDSQRLMHDGQKFMELGQRLLSMGWKSTRGNGAT